MKKLLFRTPNHLLCERNFLQERHHAVSFIYIYYIERKREKERCKERVGKSVYARFAAAPTRGLLSSRRSRSDFAPIFPDRTIRRSRLSSFHLATSATRFIRTLVPGLHSYPLTFVLLTGRLRVSMSPRRRLEFRRMFVTRV